MPIPKPTGGVTRLPADTTEGQRGLPADEPEFEEGEQIAPGLEPVEQSTAVGARTGEKPA